MERTWIRPKVHFIQGRSYEDVERGGGGGGGGCNFVCVLRGFEKSVRSMGGRKIWLKS